MVCKPNAYTCITVGVLEKGEIRQEKSSTDLKDNNTYIILYVYYLQDNILFCKIVSYRLLISSRVLDVLSRPTCQYTIVIMLL